MGAIIEKILEYLDFIKPILANLSNINVAGVGSGWLFGALGAVGVSLFGLSIGRTKAVISLLSIYVAFTFSILFPYRDILKSLIGGQVPDYWLYIGIFLAVYVIVFIMLSLSFMRKRLSSEEFSLIGVVALCILQLGFVVSIILSSIPKDLIAQWSFFNFSDYFATKQALFLWSIAPFLIIPFIRSK